MWQLYPPRSFGSIGASSYDLDTRKALLIYAYSHLDAGGTLLAQGRKEEAISEFRAAEKIAPSLRGEIKDMSEKEGRR
jgi:hypothetical protein